MARACREVSLQSTGAVCRRQVLGLCDCPIVTPPRFSTTLFTRLAQAEERGRQVTCQDRQAVEVRRVRTTTAAKEDDSCDGGR